MAVAAGRALALVPTVPTVPTAASTVDVAGDGAVEQPSAVSDAVEIVPALPETVPTVDGETADEEPAGSEAVTVDAQPVEAPAVARPRRRRAASRPAGPPV